MASKDYNPSMATIDMTKEHLLTLGVRTIPYQTTRGCPCLKNTIGLLTWMRM